MGWMFKSATVCLLAAMMPGNALADDESNQPKPPGWFSKLDRDNNGTLSKQEASRFFQPMNSDGDDVVTVAEATAFMKERMERAARDGTRRPGGVRVIVTSQMLDSREKTGNGLWVLSLGHSCVAPAMRPLSQIAPAAGFQNHTQVIQIHGGAGGAAKAQWEYVEKQDAKPALQSGKIDVLTFGYLVRDRKVLGSDVEDFQRWIELGLKHNPEMRFYIQDLWPWLTDLMPKVSPEVPLEEYTLEKYEAALAHVSETLTQRVNQLNEKYPGKVHVIPVAGAMVELVRRVLDEKLPGVDAVLVPPKATGSGLYRDHIHPTGVVSALEGYVYFACLYDMNPAQLPGGLYKDEKLDQVLREVAWRTVTAHPHSGVSR